MQRSSYQPPSQTATRPDPKRIAHRGLRSGPLARLGLRMPQEAVDGQLPGQLVYQGWLVCWRWHPHGALELRADHRMTNTRWWLVEPSGDLVSFDVPSEMYRADDPQARLDNQAAWRRYGEDLRTYGMSGESTPPSAVVAASSKLELPLWLVGDGEWLAGSKPTAAGT